MLSNLLAILTVFIFKFNSFQLKGFTTLIVDLLINCLFVPYLLEKEYKSSVNDDEIIFADLSGSDEGGCGITENPYYCWL